MFSLLIKGLEFDLVVFPAHAASCERLNDGVVLPPMRIDIAFLYESRVYPRLADDLQYREEIR